MMRATLWKVTGEWWEKVEELEVASPPPRALVTPRLESLKIRDFLRGEELGPDIPVLETDTYILWRVWKEFDEAAYVLNVPTSKGGGNER